MTSHRLRVVNTGSLLLVLLLGASPALGAMRVANGSYVGNGSTNRTISSVGFQPDVVLVKAVNNEHPAMRTSTMGTDLSKELGGGALDVAMLRSFTSTGFTIGDHKDVNDPGVTYHWTAWKAAPGELVLGSYTGDKVDGRIIGGIGFQPAYVIILPDTGDPATERFEGQPVDECFEIKNSDVKTNRIDRFEADGFRIGDDNATNDGGKTYHYVAWASGPGVESGSYVGNKVAGKTVSLPHAVDMIRVKGEVGNEGPYRPSTLSGDNTLVLHGTAMKTNLITSVDDTRFALGDDDIVNKDGVTYYYTLFTDAPPVLTDLAITKSVDDPTPDVGDTLTYTVTLQNLGSLVALLVTVSDLLPSGVTYRGHSNTAGTYLSATGLWSIPLVASGATQTLTISATVDAGTSGTTIVNTASLTGLSGTDTNPVNNSDTAGITVLTADLGITKTVNDDAPSVGDTVEFTLVLENLGPGDAGQIKVSDLLPAGLTYTGHTALAGVYVPGTGVWGVDDLAASQTTTLTIRATVDAGKAGDSITNTAIIGSQDHADPVSSNNTDAVTLNVESADLAVGKEVDQSRPNVGETVTYTVKITNFGPSDATGVDLQDLLPSGLTYVSDSPSAGSYVSGSGLWAVGTMASGESATLTLEATVNAGSEGRTLTNTAILVAADQADPDTTNNVSAIDIYVPAVDIQISKSVTAGTHHEGSSVTFTVDVVNAGPDTATGVVVRDLLPSGLSYQSSTPSQGSYALGTGDWSLGALAPGAGATIQVTASVDPGMAGTVLTNTASLLSLDQADVDPANDEASAGVTVPYATLSVSKVVDHPAAAVGELLRFTVEVTNDSAFPVTGVVIHDPRPSEFSFSTHSHSQGSYIQGSGDWDVGTLPPLANAILTIDATAKAGTEGTVLTNTASLTAVDQSENTPANNTASATVAVVGLDLSLDKSINTASPNEGDPVVYTLTLTNAGPDDATGVAVTDLLPSGVTYSGHSTASGSYVPGTGVWTVGSLADGADAVLTISGTVDVGTAGSTVVNTASITAVDQQDSNPTNDTNTAAFGAQSADLHLAKSVDDPNPNAGGQVVFTVSLTNEGPTDATGITVADPLPAGLAFVSASADAGVYADGTGVWSIPFLAASDTALLDITASVNTGTGGSTIVNSAVVTALDQADPSGANNSDTATLTVQSADLSIDKAVDDSTPEVGATVAFTITVANAGPSDATGVVVSDPLPSGLTFVSATPTAGTYGSGTGLWTVGSIPSGASRILTLSATVSAAAASGSVTNTATITASDQEDPDTFDRSDFVTIGAAQTVTVSTFPQASTSLLPGSPPVEVLRVRLTNSASVAATLTSMTVRNRTAGSGTQAQLDASWSPLQLVKDPSGAATLLGAGSLASGTRTFSGLSVTVPAAGSVDLAVLGGASLTARDGDALDLYVVTTGDVVFGGAVTVAGSFPLDPAGSFTVDGMAVAQVAVHALGASNATAGATGVVLFDVTLPRNGYVDDTLQQFRLANLGTASSTDLAALRLWRDDGDGSFGGASGGDILLGSMTWSGSLWSLGGMNVSVPASGVRLFAVADVAPLAAEGATFQMSLPAPPTSGALMASNNDGPRDGAVASPTTVTLLADSGAVLAVRGEAVSGGTLVPGGGSAEIIRLVVANRTAVSQTLTGLVFTNAATGTGSTVQLDADWASLSLMATPTGTAPPSGSTLGTQTASGGLVQFNGLSLSIAAGDSVTLSVLGSAALGARDGDVLDLRVANAAAVTFAGAPARQGTYPIDPPGSFTVDGMVAAQLQLHPVAASGANPGDTDRLVFDVTLPANGYAPDQLQGVRLTQLGDAAAGTDVAGVHLWRDGGNGGFDGGTADDVSLGAATWDGTRWALSGLTASVPSIGLRIFATADIAAVATPDRTLRLGLGADVIPAVSMASGNDGPLDVAVSNPEALTINSRPLTVVRFAGATSPETTVLPGAPAVEMMRLTVTNEGAEAETLTAITLNDTSTGPGSPTQLTRNWSTLTLAHQESSTNLDAAAMSGGVVAFSGFSLPLPAGGSATLTIHAGASLHARDGDTLDLQLAGSETAIFSRAVDVQGAWPLDPAGHLVVDGMAAAQVSLVNVADAEVFAGETRRLALHAIVPANGYEADVLQGMRLANLGTAQPGDDIAAMELWRDGGDGGFDAGSGDDVRLGALAWDGTAWQIAGISQVLPITACRIFVSADIDPDAAEGRTVRLSLPLGTSPAIQVQSNNDGPRDAAVSNGGTLTILESILGVVTVSADVQTIQTVLPGGALKEALRLRFVNFTGEPQTLTGLQVTNAASGPGTAANLDADWSELRLGAEAAGTATLATGTMASGRTTFSGLSVPLPVNRAVVLVVSGGASLMASDADLLDLEVTAAGDLSFSGSPDLFAGWPLDPTGYLVVDGMAADQITLRSAPEGTFAGGSTRNLAFGAVLPANGYQADVLNRLNLVNLGNARAGTDLATMELWVDDGDAVFEASEDRNLGRLTHTGDRWEITALTEPIPLAGLPVFVSVDVSESAQDGRSIQLGLPSEPDVALGVGSGNDGPRDRAVINGYTQVITSVDRVTFSAVSVASGTTRPGTHLLPLGHLVATNTYEAPRTLTEIIFSNLTAGSGTRNQLDDELEVLVLRGDGDGDGQLDTDGTDPVIATTSFAEGQAIFRGLSWTIEASQSRHLFLTGEVSLRDATDGDVLAARLNDVLSVTFAEPTAVAAEWPVDSGARWVVDGMVSGQIVNFGGGNRTLGAGIGPVAGLDIQIPPNGYLEDRLERLDIVNLGTAGPGEMTGLQVWADGGDDRFEALEGDDVALGNLNWIGDRWRSDPLDLPIPASGARVFVSFNVVSSLTDSASVRLAIPVDGITVASLNDGPLDARVAYPETMILSSAPLLATLRTSPSVTTVGQEIALTMTVTNNGPQTISGILADLPATSGSASVSLTGAAPSAPLLLAPGETTDLAWTYVATTAGQVRFTGGVEGTLPDDAPSQSLRAASNLHTVVLEASSMDLFPLEARASSVNRGQQDVVPLTLTFRNPGEADRGASIRVNGFVVRFENENGEDVGPGDLLSGMEVKEGNRVYAALAEPDLGNSGSELRIDFATPLLVTTLEPATLSLRLNIAEDTVVPTFRTVITDSTFFDAVDAVSGAPVVVSLGEGAYPVRSGVMNLVSESFGVDVASAEIGELRVSPGHRNLEIADLELESVGIDGISSEVRAGGFSLMLVDEAGDAIPEPGRVLENIRVVSPFNVLVDAPLGVDSPATLNLKFTNLLTLPVNTLVGIRVEGHLRPDAPLRAFRVRLGAPEGFDLRDANTRSVVPARYAATPVEGPLVRVERPAEIAELSGTPGFPDQAAVGERDLTAFTVRVHHPGGSDVGRVRVDGFSLQCRNEDRTLLAPAGFLDRIRVLREGAAVAVLQDLSAVAQAIHVPLPGLLLEPGQSLDFEVRVDIEATAPASFLEITLTGPGTGIVDANTGEPVVVAPATGGELPLFSGLMRLQPPARELAVGLEDGMPTALVADGHEHEVGTLTLVNPAPEGTGRIRIDRVRTRGADAALAPVALGAVASEVRFHLDGVEVGRSAILDADSLEAWVEFSEGIFVDPGETVSLEARLVLGTETAVTSFRVGWLREDIGVAQPGGALLTVEVRAADGRAFPLWTEPGTFNVADLESSYSNFPNPFSAGRESTTFVYYLPRDGSVTLRLWTPRGEEVLTLLDGVPQVAGLHQNDRWDGRNGGGLLVTNGVFIAELSVRFDDGTVQRFLRKVAVMR